MEIYSFLELNGFRLVDQGESTSFGDYYDTLETDDFRLRFSSSKSFQAIDICSNEDRGSWFDLGLVIALVENKAKLDEVVDIEICNKFLKDKLNRLKELFNSSNYPNTQRKLFELGNERARQLFPGQFL